MNTVAQDSVEHWRLAKLILYHTRTVFSVAFSLFARKNADRNKNCANHQMLLRQVVQSPFRVSTAARLPLGKEGQMYR
eukprot:scaffold154198_cov58-Attheya_sp.AAC.3